MPNSKKGRYTQYSNKIGLYSNTKGGFIKNSNEVVLSFPFKDTVLEAGMSKEDVGREERFLHLSLDSKDIDTLEEPKVLTNFKYIDKDGEKILDENSDIEFFDKNGNLKQNLLIKGNNLLALYTLRQKLAGKIKLIYIDPPYNTGNDGFKYNDSFNHSSWLTFMKNRLEVARELLREDGVIFVSCDDNEQAYIKVLMDEIFLNNNFISTIVDIVKPEGRRYGFIAQAHEYVLVYAKNTVETKMYEMTDLTKKLPYNDKNGSFDIVGLRNRNVKSFNSTNRPNLYYPFYVNSKIIDENGFMKVSVDKVEGCIEVFPSKADGLQSVWRWGKEKAKNNSDEIVAKTGSDGMIKLFTKTYSLTTLPKSFWSDKDIITQKGTQQIDSLFNGKVFAFPKPEALLQKIIEISTVPEDIVLDYHLGSGTASAVAHKMGRKWIGVEQMDYIEDVAKERIKKVVLGEQGGISKSVNWQGGGSFVYLELKKYNQEYVDLITSAKTIGELEDVYADMRSNAFLKFWFDKAEFEKDENFRSLDLEKRKKALIEILDENQLYLNYADMNDSRHKVSKEEKILTNKFYGEN